MLEFCPHLLFFLEVFNSPLMQILKLFSFFIDNDRKIRGWSGRCRCGSWGRNGNGYYHRLWLLALRLVNYDVWWLLWLWLLNWLLDGLLLAAQVEDQVNWSLAAQKSC